MLPIIILSIISGIFFLALFLWLVYVSIKLAELIKAHNHLADVLEKESQAMEVIYNKLQKLWLAYKLSKQESGIVFTDLSDDEEQDEDLN